jgi:hypothetical protein
MALNHLAVNGYLLSWPYQDDIAYLDLLHGDIFFLPVPDYPRGLGPERQEFPNRSVGRPFGSFWL